jgi:uncharacterized protein (DUF488 family)
VRSDSLEVLTIGHSSHPYDRFLALLRMGGVTAVADVRTAPFSRHYPHFNKEQLREELRLDSIAYVFLGRELGGRPSNRTFYSDSIADYEKMATTEPFKKGLDRVIEGAKKYRIALVCSEHNPLDCHRCLLVGRGLSERGVRVTHILADGAAITQAETEKRLLELSGRSSDDLLMSWEQRLAAAYRDRARKIAFVELCPDPKTSDRIGLA